MLFWAPKAEDSTVAYQQETVTDQIQVKENEAVTKNLIICYDDKTKEFTNLVLEVLNSNNNKLTYITIPVRTGLTLSKTLYQKIELDYPEVPQVMKLSTISKYLDFNSAFDYEMQIVEELLGISIDYYTAMPLSVYETIFTDQYIKQEDGYDSVPMEVFSKDFKNQLATFDQKDKLSAFIKELYSSLQSDYTYEDKMNYIDNYYQAELNGATFDLINGKNLNNDYEIDREAAAQQLTEITTDTQN